MHPLAYIFFALALGCEVFAYWGLNTVAGQKAFDEMAGMIPFAAGVVGFLFAFVALFAWRRYNTKRKPRSSTR